ncbi:MAG TPA: MBL fold metallo-hydrolase, partial [Edaphobacter sp.]|nr:MBL fold metallo-hydrolase [Edaphobacter sp.]
ATGYSLHPLYSKIPAALQGFVELVYDLNNQPSFRLIEPLLYRSQYYDRCAQSLTLSINSGDDRPFVLSTPRLPVPEHFDWNIPFAAPEIDCLFRSKAQPIAENAIAEMLSLEYGTSPLVRSFFTTDIPSRYIAYDGPGVRWRYFGHACILIEVRGVSILLDPVLSYTFEKGISRYTYSDLPDSIDYALITHNHQDHVLFETLLQLRHKIKHIVVPRSSGGSLQDPSLRWLLYECGFNSVLELGEMEQIASEAVQITGLPFFGEHADLDIRTKLGYFVRTARHTMMFVSDSCNIDPALYKHVRVHLGPADVLFVGMECDGAPLSWLYGPLLTRRLERTMDESRRLSGSTFEQASDMVNRFGCKEVYVYAMGQEPWLNYIMSIKYTETSRPIVESNKLIQWCAERGLIAERLYGEKEILDM